jgi:hypothetical protein
MYTLVLLFLQVLETLLKLCSCYRQRRTFSNLFYVAGTEIFHRQIYLVITEAVSLEEHYHSLAELSPS